MTTPGTTAAWMRVCTRIFLDALGDAGDEQLREPSGLPGWTRQHLVGHVHFNACALSRLMSWAATGVESRMYTGPEQRASEIESAVALEPGDLRRLVCASADQLMDEIEALPAQAWEHEVVTARGRAVSASEIPWMRAREVGIHAVDLGVGVEFADLPEAMLGMLAREAAGMHAVAGQSAPLAAWLTGRAPAAPDLGPWL